MIVKNIKDKAKNEFMTTFKEINFYLKKYEIEAWMDAGLLLKYSRGQNLYPSSDIDFGVKSGDTKNIILFSNHMKKIGYLVSILGNTSVIFEGITIARKITDDHFITADIYIYYPLANYYCRPNSHKPLKQSYLARNLFRIFNKLNVILNLNLLKNLFVIKKLLKYIFFIYSKLYFQFAITSQFAIPKKLLENFKNIKIDDEIVSIPQNNIKYIEWRYGDDWKIPNKNWRLTDGNMVFLCNLKNYWNYFCSAPYFVRSEYLLKKSKTNRRSIFRFDDEELKVIKKSKIKSELFKNNLS